MNGESNMAEDRNHAERVAALEVSHDQLTKDVRTLANSIGDLASEQRQSMNDLGNELRSVIGSIGDKVSQSAKTPWGNLIAGAVLIVAIIAAIAGGFTSGYIRDQNRTEKNLDEVIKLVALHQKDGTGHNDVAKNTLDITKLDNVIQREMKLIDETRKAQLAALDQRLQREMDLKDEALSSIMVSLSKDLQVLLDQNIKSIADHAAHNERLISIENELKTLRNTRNGHK